MARVLLGRLPLLKEYLQGRLPTDKATIEEILSRPRAADRVYLDKLA